MSKDQSLPTPETAERPRLRALFEAMKRRGLADDGDWDCMTKEELDSFGDALDEALAHSETVRRKVPNVILGLGPQRNDDYAAPQGGAFAAPTATPRVDAEVKRIGTFDVTFSGDAHLLGKDTMRPVVSADFARQLEREIEEAKDAEARTREKLEDLYEAGTRSAGERTFIAPRTHDEASERIAACVWEIQVIADAFGYDPFQWLADEETVAPSASEGRDADNTRILELHSELFHSLQNTDEAIAHFDNFAGQVLEWCEAMLTHDDLPPVDRDIWGQRAKLVRDLLTPPEELASTSDRSVPK